MQIAMRMRLGVVTIFPPVNIGSTRGALDSAACAHLYLHAGHANAEAGRGGSASDYGTEKDRMKIITPFSRARRFHTYAQP